MCIVQITAGNRWHTQTEPFEGSWRRGYLWRWGQGTRKPQGTVRDLGASEQNLTTQRPAWTKGMTYDWNADGEGILDEAMTFELDAASLQQPNRENVQESNISTPTLRSFCPFFLFHFFLMWTIFKVFIEFVTLSHLFFFFNVLLFFFFQEACGILAPRPRIEPTPPALEGEILTTEPPRKPLLLLFCQSSPLAKPDLKLLKAQSL